MPPKRAPEGAKKSGSEGPLVGARVRVQCSDGVFYDGGVTAWDAASAEYKIVLDDGNPAEAHALPDARMRAPLLADAVFARGAARATRAQVRRGRSRDESLATCARRRAVFAHRQGHVGRGGDQEGFRGRHARGPAGQRRVKQKVPEKEGGGPRSGSA